eukprot:TRINITY_DN17235_c0_g1_i1.p1 TRINITY_DN17235_c0_g1~~TRINITY_DN17235_c0_g1_i1.p1  ORF type:complete len:163 (+),score=21.03 TRINITY_DN17235_c0_g1_i1:53-541(+)
MRRSQSVPVVRCGSPDLTESKEEFLRGVDRFAACYGGREVMKWIARSSSRLRDGGRVAEATSPERLRESRERELSAVRAPDTKFDKWMAQHRDLIQPFFQGNPVDPYSPSLRSASLSAISRRDHSVSSSFSPVHRPPVIGATPSRSAPMYTSQGGVMYQSVA